MNPKLLQEKFFQMIREDSGWEDITTSLFPSKKVKAKIITKSSGILSGVEEVESLLKLFEIKVLKKKKDGERIKPQEEIFLLEGTAQEILVVERTALNLLSKMSGISTLTKKALEKAKKINPQVKIAGTRKTTPLFSSFEKKAIMVAGADSHRFGLYDLVLLKDNHLKLLQNNIKKALKRAKKETSFTKKIEIEVSSKKEAIEAARYGADIIMLDNFSPQKIKETIKELKKKKLRERVILEASGGITLENIEGYAKTGVDVISLGALTHSAKSLDFSLEIV